MKSPKSTWKSLKERTKNPETLFWGLIEELHSQKYPCSIQVEAWSKHNWSHSDFDQLCLNAKLSL